jgi:hypothetical protein
MSVSFGTSFQLKADAHPKIPPTVAGQATLLDDVEWALRNGVDAQGQPRMWTYKEVKHFVEERGGFRGEKNAESKWSKPLLRRLAADAAKPGGFRQHRSENGVRLYWQHVPGELPQTFSRAPQTRRAEPDTDEPEKTTYENALEEANAAQKARYEMLLRLEAAYSLENSLRGKPGGQPAWSPEYQRRYGMFLVDTQLDAPPVTLGEDDLMVA